MPKENIKRKGGAVRRRRGGGEVGGISHLDEPKRGAEYLTFQKEAGCKEDSPSRKGEKSPEAKGRRPLSYKHKIGST